MIMFKVKVKPIEVIPPILIVSVLAIMPFILSEYYLSVLRMILLWLALSISWHFFSGMTRYVSLGSAAFFGLGLYITAKYLEQSARGNFMPLPLPIILLLASLVNFGLALIIGLATLRIRGIYFAILTFGIAVVASMGVQWWEIKITGTRGTYLPIFDSKTVYYSVLLAALVAFLVTTILRRSKFGLALRMIGECEDAAAHVGVDTSRYKILGFAVSAMLIGLMGGSFSIRFPYVEPTSAFSSDYSFLPAVITLLGGAGSVYGPILGAIMLSLLQEYLRVAFAHYFLIILGVLLVLIVLFMPDGILGLIKSRKMIFAKKSGKTSPNLLNI